MMAERLFFYSTFDQLKTMNHSVSFLFTTVGLHTFALPIKLVFSLVNE